MLKKIILLIITTVLLTTTTFADNIFDMMLPKKVVKTFSIKQTYILGVTHSFENSDVIISDIKKIEKEHPEIKKLFVIEGTPAGQLAGKTPGHEFEKVLEYIYEKGNLAIGGENKEIQNAVPFPRKNSNCEEILNYVKNADKRTDYTLEFIDKYNGIFYMGGKTYKINQTVIIINLIGKNHIRYDYKHYLLEKFTVINDGNIPAGYKECKK